MNSDELARYIEATDTISKPWLLMQLRLKKLQERRDTLLPDEYTAELANLHQELLTLPCLKAMGFSGHRGARV